MSSEVDYDKLEKKILKLDECYNDEIYRLEVKLENLISRIDDLIDTIISTIDDITADNN